MKLGSSVFVVMVVVMMVIAVFFNFIIIVIMVVHSMNGSGLRFLAVEAGLILVVILVKMEISHDSATT